MNSRFSIIFTVAQHFYTGESKYNLKFVLYRVKREVFYIFVNYKINNVKKLPTWKFSGKVISLIKHRKLCLLAMELACDDNNNNSYNNVEMLFVLGSSTHKNDATGNGRPAPLLAEPRYGAAPQPYGMFI